MQTLVVFGNHTARDTWNRARVFMGTGWVWVPGKHTFMRGEDRIVQRVIVNEGDMHLLHGTQYDLIIEHESFKPVDWRITWDGFTRANLLRRN